MPRHRPAYLPERREQTIRSWIVKANPSPRAAAAEAERDEVKRLRKGFRRLQQERNILATAAAWFADEPRST